MKNKIQNKENNWRIWIAIILLTLFIIYLNWPEKKEEIPKIIEENKTNELIDIMDYLVSTTDLSMGVCYDYASYYDRILKKNWPELDVRWIRNFDICNNGTYCDNLHTLVLVGGWGTECLIDQNGYVCYVLKDEPDITNKTNSTENKGN